MINGFVLKNKDAAFRIIDGVAIIVNPETGIMYTLNEVGTHIWQLADGNRTISEIVDAIYDSFEAEKSLIAEDARKFIMELAEKQMIVIQDRK